MKAIVTGASGMLGGQVLRLLRQRNWDVEGWSYLTLRAPDGVTFLARGDDVPAPYELDGTDLIVHCAALTDADALEVPRGSDEFERARFVNAKWPESMASAARNVGARFVYISTDAVYDGEQPGLRREDEKPNPLSVYAKTKWEGEERVLAAYPESLVVRTSMFGWTLPGHRPKFAEEILAGLTNGTPLRLFEDAIFSPLHVRALADALLALAVTPATGIFNVGASAPESKSGFGYLIAEEFGLDPSPIEAVPLASAGLTAGRARNTSLDVRRAERLLGPLPTIRDGIQRLQQEWESGDAVRYRGRNTFP